MSTGGWPHVYSRRFPRGWMEAAVDEVELLSQQMPEDKGVGCWV
jgi:hypothetical protein